MVHRKIPISKLWRNQLHRMRKIFWNSTSQDTICNGSRCLMFEILDWTNQDSWQWCIYIYIIIYIYILYGTYHYFISIFHILSGVATFLKPTVLQECAKGMQKYDAYFCLHALRTPTLLRPFFWAKISKLPRRKIAQTWADKKNTSNFSAQAFSVLQFLVNVRNHLIGPIWTRHTTTQTIIEQHETTWSKLSPLVHWCHSFGSQNLPSFWESTRECKSCSGTWVHVKWPWFGHSYDPTPLNFSTDFSSPSLTKMW